MNKPSVGASFVAGSLSGTCSTLLFQPLDLVKTRQQICARTSAYPTSLGIVGTASNVVRHENVSALWRGLTPSLSRCVPGVGMYFTSLTTLQRLFLGDRQPTPLEAGALGASARALSTTMLLPVTVVKTRYESGRYQYGSVRHALWSMARLEGVRGLYSGLWVTIARDMPFSGLYYMFYSHLKSKVQYSPFLCDRPSLTGVATFGCGLVSGFMACLITHPADVVKTRVQTTTANRSTWAAALFIFQTRGASGFFAGMAPRVVRRSLMAAMAWTVYERIVRSISI